MFKNVVEPSVSVSIYTLNFGERKQHWMCGGIKILQSDISRGAVLVCMKLTETTKKKSEKWRDGENPCTERGQEMNVCMYCGHLKRDTERSNDEWKSRRWWKTKPRLKTRLNIQSERTFVNWDITERKTKLEKISRKPKSPAPPSRVVPRCTHIRVDTHTHTEKHTRN